MFSTMRNALVVLTLAAAASVAFANEPNMMEGSWEVTTKMEMAGMPFQIPPQTHQHCMTKKDFVPDVAQKDQKCTVRDQKITGDTVSWRIQCTGAEGKMDGEGRVKYAGKTYSGTMQAKMTDKSGEAIDMKLSFQGRHLGACKADAPTKKKAGDY